jgi:uncharacterized protein YciI
MLSIERYDVDAAVTFSPRTLGWGGTILVTVGAMACRLRWLSLLTAAVLVVGCSADDTELVAPDVVAPELLEVPPGGTAFVNVTVVPMTDDVMLSDQVVVVVDGRILHVRAAAEVELPSNVETIAGTGKYLMPGLFDSHVHTWFEGENTLFVANGVTSIVNLFGDPLHLSWRDRITAGELLGPTIYTSGPIVDGADPFWPGSDVVTDAASAAQVVSAQQAAGYDMVKVYSKLSNEAWQAVLDEAQARGMPAVGHVPYDVDYRAALGSWQTVNHHLEGFAEEAGGAPLPLDVAQWPGALAAIEPGAVEQLAAETAAAGMWNTPTIVVYRYIVPGIDQRPEMRYVHPVLRDTWATSYAAGTSDFFDAYAAYTGYISAWTRALHDAGAPLLVGSDCTNAWTIHGWSLHEELVLFQEAGISPYETLRAATIDAATAIGRADDVGTVEVGKRADLLLLDADPTLDVRNASARSGVMLRGQWHSAAALQQRLDELAADYESMP